MPVCVEAVYEFSDDYQFFAQRTGQVVMKASVSGLRPLINVLQVIPLLHLRVLSFSTQLIDRINE